MAMISIAPHYKVNRYYRKHVMTVVCFGVSSLSMYCICIFAIYMLCHIHSHHAWGSFEAMVESYNEVNLMTNNMNCKYPIRKSGRGKRNRITTITMNLSHLSAQMNASNYIAAGRKSVAEGFWNEDKLRQRGWLDRHILIAAPERPHEQCSEECQKRGIIRAVQYDVQWYNGMLTCFTNCSVVCYIHLCMVWSSIFN